MMLNTTNSDISRGNEDIEESLRSPLLPDPAPPVRMTTETQPTTLDEPEMFPPLSSFFAKCQFWWKFAKIPFLFFIVNTTALSSLLLEDRHQYYVDSMYETTTTSQTMDPTVVRMRDKSALLVILFLFNTAVLYRAAFSIEQQVNSMRRRQESSSSNADNHTADSSSSSDDDSTHVYAKISKTIDMFLCQGRAPQLPEVSFLVNALFLLTALSFVATAVSFSVSVFLCSSKASSVCAYKAPDLDAKGVPELLRPWASDHYYGNDESQVVASYVHLDNGMTYFAGTNRTSWDEKYGNDVARGRNNNNNNDNDFGYHAMYGLRVMDQVLFSAGPDGTLRSYPQIRYPRDFKKLAVGGSEEQSKSEIFCCTYMSKENNIDKKNWRVWEVLRGWPSVLCVGGEWPGDDKRKTQLRTIRLPIDTSRHASYMLSMESIQLRVYEGALWIRSQYHVRVEIYKLNPITMNLTAVAGTFPDGQSSNGATPCLDWVNAVRCFVGAPLLLLMAYWQLKFRDIPSGMASLCLGLLAVMIYMDYEWAVVLGGLASVGATISLFHALPPWMSRDMVHWGMYTSLAALAAMPDEFGWEPCSIVCLCIIIGVVLHHPVLQIMGWLFGAVMLVQFLVECLSPYGYGGNLLAEIPILLVVFCGFRSLGFSLDKHRPYLVYYARRLTRILTLAARNSFSTGQGRGDTVSRHQHSNQSTVPFLNTRDD